jgi:hypothetical protein
MAERIEQVIRAGKITTKKEKEDNEVHQLGSNQN